MKKYLLLLPAVLLVPLLMAQDSTVGFVRIAVDEIEWTVRPSGTSFAILHGDPEAEGLYIGPGTDHLRQPVRTIRHVPIPLAPKLFADGIGP